MTGMHRVYTHHDMVLDYIETPKGLGQIAFAPAPASSIIEGVPFPNFQLAIAGRPFGFVGALADGYSALPGEMQLTQHRADDHELFFSYAHELLGLTVEIRMQLIAGAAVIRQFTRVINNAGSPITITHLSSFAMQGLANGGGLPWYDKRKLRLHYCRQTWEGEGQWCTDDLESLGLYPSSKHPSTLR